MGTVGHGVGPVREAGKERIEHRRRQLALGPARQLHHVPSDVVGEQRAHRVALRHQAETPHDRQVGADEQAHVVVERLHQRRDQEPAGRRAADEPEAPGRSVGEFQLDELPRLAQQGRDGFARHGELRAHRQYRYGFRRRRQVYPFAPGRVLPASFRRRLRRRERGVFLKQQIGFFHEYRMIILVQRREGE